jgi:hypothetical protein
LVYIDAHVNVVVFADIDVDIDVDVDSNMDLDVEMDMNIVMGMNTGHRVLHICIFPGYDSFERSDVKYWISVKSAIQYPTQYQTLPSSVQYQRLR